MEVKLVVRGGWSKAREIPLPATIFVIGRGTQCHLRPHCRSVSKWHCAIARWAGKVVVRDLKSANGTFINNHRISGEVRVRDGDVLRVGSLELAIRVVGGDYTPLPVQIVRESDVKWLMDNPPDEFSLNTNAATLIGELPTDLLPPSAPAKAPANGMDGKVKHAADQITISAGEYLREYFQQPKR
jgi:pSer/pThr/pTyr-binding forkhead associated (FHA) protein